MMAGAALLLAAVAARGQDAHGAIAFGQVDQDEAVAYGLAWDYPARDDAQEAAVNACLSGGGSDCTVLAWFQNGCGALTVDQYGMAQGKGARSLDRAEARALQACEAAGGVGCAVVVSQCVSPDGQPDTWAGSESVLAPPEDEPGSAAAAGTAGDRERSAADAPPRDEGREGQPASQEATEPVAARNEVLYFAAAGPKCTEPGSNSGERGEDRCWEEIPSQPGCFVWTLRTVHRRVEDWTGGCSGDTAHGTGSLSYVSASSGEVFLTVIGSLMHGKRNGHWVGRFTSGFMWEGLYVDGKANGRWVMRWASGAVREGSIVDDVWNGHWVFRHADGSVSEGPYVDGKRNGHWVERNADGDVEEGPYVDDERNGHWVIRYADGSVVEGPYTDGKRNGHWVFLWANGRVWEGPYVDGKYHGRWVIRYDGTVQEGPYIDGEQHGRWVIRYADGTVHEGPYVDGERHGRWVIRYASDGSLEYEYRNGSREGQPGVYLTPAGNRYPGRWSGGCFRDAEGRAWVGTKDACGS